MHFGCVRSAEARAAAPLTDRLLPVSSRRSAGHSPPNCPRGAKFLHNREPTSSILPAGSARARDPAPSSGSDLASGPPGREALFYVAPSPSHTALRVGIDVGPL